MSNSITKVPVNGVELRFSLSESAFLDACNAYWLCIGQDWKSNLRNGFLAFIAGSLFIYFHGGHDYLYWLGIFFLILACLFVVKVSTRPWLWRRFYRSVKSYDGETQVAFREKGIEIKSKYGEGEFAWEAFTLYLVLEDYLYLFVDKREFYPIPISAFEDEMQLNTTISLMRKKLEKAK